MTNREAIKVIEWIKNTHPEQITCEALDLAISALEKQEQDRWIPVTERLPEKDGDYLVTYEKGFAEDYGLDPIGIAPFEVDCEGFGIWVERFDKMTLGSLGCDWTEIKVVACMPLPEPYTEEES